MCLGPFSIDGHLNYFSLVEAASLLEGLLSRVLQTTINDDI